MNDHNKNNKAGRNNLFTLSSFMDRLTAPETTSGVAQSISQLKQSILNELLVLFNTKRAINASKDDIHQRPESILEYGLPDLSTLNPHNPKDCAYIAREMQRSIEQFESRLSDVQVRLVKSEEKDKQNKVIFHIDAMLNIDPNPEPISMDTCLDIGSWRFVDEG